MAGHLKIGSAAETTEALRAYTEERFTVSLIN